MATERTCELPPSLPGMGNITNNTTSYNNTITDSHLQAETQNLNHPVHSGHISGGKISNSNFSTNQKQFDDTTTDWCSEEQEEPSDAKNVEFSLQTSAHKNTRNSTRNHSNRNAAIKNSDVLEDVPPPDRVYTPPNFIGESRFSTPSFSPANPINPDHDRTSNSDNTEFNSKCKECILEVDLRSLGRGYVLQPVASNRLCMLNKLMMKRREMIGKNAPIFSPTKLMDGLNTGNIGVYVYREKQMEQMRARIAKPVDSLTSSSSSLSNESIDNEQQQNYPTVPSHRFTLRFDTPQQCSKGIALLTQLGLSPRYPTPPVIRGKVYGFHFLTENDDISSLLQKYAWYIGGAPSLTITRVLHRHIEGLYRDECYFTVSASEFNHIVQIPSIRSGRPLKWEPYRGPKIIFCTHCNKQDKHFRKSCPLLAQSNAVQGIRDACVMCGSFEHVVANCPEMEKEDVVCSICKNGKHTVRACKLTRGSYAKVLVGADSTTGQTKTKWTWKNGSMTAAQRMAADQQQQQQQQQRQQQQHQADDETVFIARQARSENEHYQAEISRMKSEISRLSKSIDSITQANNDMREMMNSLIQSNHALAQQVTILVNNTNNIMMGCAPTVQPAPLMTTTATASRNTTKRVQAHNPINQSKVNNYFAPLAMGQTAQTKHAFNTLTHMHMEHKQPTEGEFDHDDHDTDHEQGQLDTEDEHEEENDDDQQQYHQQRYQKQTLNQPSVPGRAKRRQDHSARATPTTPTSSTSAARATNNALPTSAVVLSQRMNSSTANKKPRK